MTPNQLTNILRVISDHNYENKNTIISLLEEKLDKSMLNFDQNNLDKDRVIFIYNNYKYKIAINSKGLLSNFIESKNYSLIKNESIKEYNKFFSELELFNFDYKKFEVCNCSYVSDYCRKKSCFKVLRSNVSDVIEFNEIKYNSNQYFYFKVFIELTKKYMLIHSMNHYDFNFENSFFKLNSFFNIYPKSIIKDIEVDFDLEVFLNNPNIDFIKENEYKIILNNYENKFNDLDKNYNYNSYDSYDYDDDDDYN